MLAGVALAPIPGLPAIELAPEVVLLLVLPPVIYSSAVAQNWREFQFNPRPISLLAFGGVVFTTVAVAIATRRLLGLSWPVGFLIGAIVSPPDAVAALAIAGRLQLPRRIPVTLEGEGLANDAAARSSFDSPSAPSAPAHSRSARPSSLAKSFVRLASAGSCCA